MHVRSKPLISIPALACTALAALPASAEETQIRDLSGFDAIEVGGSVDLTISQGNEFLLEVRGPDGKLDDLVTEVRGGTLKITQHPRERRWFSFDSFDDFSVSVTLPELRSLQASGGSDVRTAGPLAGERLEISASGGSDIRIDVDVTELRVSTSGGSDTVLSGSTQVLVARSSGGSDLSASRLQAHEAEVHSSGGADVELDVRDRLLARASGGSDIDYSGNPQFVDAHSSGGGDVRSR